MIGVFALITFIFQQLSQLLIYDRAAIIQGEHWRLLTGNLVHFSIPHLLYNLIAFLIIGTMIELRGYRFFPVLCLSSALLIGITLFLLEPELNLYAGLSGVVSAAVTYLCLHGVREQGIWRWLCAATLAGLTVKTVIELGLGSSFILSFSEENFVPVPLSHLVGIVAALFLFLSLRMTSKLGNTI